MFTKLFYYKDYCDKYDYIFFINCVYKKSRIIKELKKYTKRRCKSEDDIMELYSLLNETKKKLVLDNLTKRAQICNDDIYKLKSFNSFKYYFMLIKYYLKYKYYHIKYRTCNIK